MNTVWSENVLQKMGQYRTLMFDAERYLWAHPQTGFQEWQAHDYLKEKFAGLGFEVTEAGDIPGFYFDIDTGREGPVVAILGELDALILPEHPECDPQTGAVHACGHHCQSAALLGIAGVLSDHGILSELCGRIRIVAVPAEEMVELSKRTQMKKGGILRHISGKSEFMRRGYFDGVDIAIMLHSDYGKVPGMSIGVGTSGIIAKRVVYHGSKSTSGACPVNGINALYAANTAMAAINALRETFPYSQNVRVQSIITEGGTSVQLMPSQVVIESNVRAYDYAVLKDANEKVNRAYSASALAFGAQVEIEDLEVYIPEDDMKNPRLTRIAYEIGCDLFGQENMYMNSDHTRWSPGGTDMGNLGAVIPCFQAYLKSPGIWGHSPQFQVESPEYAVLYHAVVLAAMTCVLLENGGEKSRRVISEYTPMFSSMKEYFDEMDRIYRIKNAVTYNADGSAILTWK